MGTRTMCTVEEFAELSDKPGVYLELEGGEVIEVPTGTLKHNLIRENISHFLARWADTHKAGIAVVEQDYQLGPGLVRRPDVSFLGRQKCHAVELDRSILPCAPDLAIEVVSVSDSAVRLRKKTREYFDAGASGVWIIYPDTREVEIWEAPGSLTTVLVGGHTLQTPLLPGFSIAVSAIFELPAPF